MAVVRCKLGSVRCCRVLSDRWIVDSRYAVASIVSSADHLEGWYALHPTHEDRFVLPHICSLQTLLDCNELGAHVNIALLSERIMCCVAFGCISWSVAF